MLGEQADLVANLNLRDNMSAGLRTAGRNLDGLDRKVSGWGKTSRAVAGHVGRGFRTAGQNIERGLFIGGAAILSAGAQVVKWAIDDEQAFTGVRKTMDLTEPEFDALHDQLKGLAATMPLNIDDLYGIAEAAGAMNIAKGDIVDFTNVVALIGTTTDITSDQAASALGHLSGLFGLTGEGFDRFAAALIDLGNKGSSTESEIIALTERMAGAASISGLSTQETLAFATAIANAGITAEAGGSAFSRIFGQIGLLVATNSTAVESWADTAGMSVKQFQKSWDQDAAGTFARIIVNLGKMDKAQQAVALSTMGITGVRDRDLILRLVKRQQTIQDTTKALDISKKAWDENTAAVTEAEKRFGTTGSKIQIFQNNLRLAGTAIGDALLPPLTDLLTDLTKWIQGHGPQVKQFGQDMAKALRNVISWAKNLDWEAIGGALHMAVSAGKGLIDAFLGAPDWLKTAVITGWGLNKLTGGAVVDILGSLTKGVFENVFARGSSSANPMWVTSATGFGGGGGGGAPGGGGMSTLVNSLGTAVAAYTASQVFQDTLKAALPEGAPSKTAPNQAIITAGAPGTTELATDIGFMISKEIRKALGFDKPVPPPPFAETLLGGGKSGIGLLDQVFGPIADGIAVLQGRKPPPSADDIGGAVERHSRKTVEAIQVLRERQIQATARGNQHLADRLSVKIHDLRTSIAAQDERTRERLGGGLSQTRAAIDRNTSVTRPRALPITIRTSLSVSAREIASEVQRVVVGNRFVAS